MKDSTFNSITIALIIILSLSVFFLYQLKSSNDEYIETLELEFKEVEEENIKLQNRIFVITKELDSLAIEYDMLGDQKQSVKVVYKEKYEKIKHLSADSIVSQFKTIFTNDSVR